MSSHYHWIPKQSSPFPPNFTHSLHHFVFLSNKSHQSIQAFVAVAHRDHRIRNLLSRRRSTHQARSSRPRFAERSEIDHAEQLEHAQHHERSRTPHRRRDDREEERDEDVEDPHDHVRHRGSLVHQLRREVLRSHHEEQRAGTALEAQNEQQQTDDRDGTESLEGEGDHQHHGADQHHRERDEEDLPARHAVHNRHEDEHRHHVPHPHHEDLRHQRLAVRPIAQRYVLHARVAQNLRRVVHHAVDAGELVHHRQHDRQHQPAEVLRLRPARRRHLQAEQTVAHRTALDEGSIGESQRAEVLLRGERQRGSDALLAG